MEVTCRGLVLLSQSKTISFSKILCVFNMSLYVSTCIYLSANMQKVPPECSIKFWRRSCPSWENKRIHTAFMYVCIYIKKNIYLVTWYFIMDSQSAVSSSPQWPCSANRFLPAALSAWWQMSRRGARTSLWHPNRWCRIEKASLLSFLADLKKKKN